MLDINKKLLIHIEHNIPEQNKTVLNFCISAGEETQRKAQFLILFLK